MISCLFTEKEKKILALLFKKKERLQLEFKQDSQKEQAYIRQRNIIIEYIMKVMGPALEARIKTWTSRKFCDEADARSQVYEHVLIAVDKYCPSRGNCSVSSFLWTVSNRAFSNFISAGKRQKRDPQSASIALNEDPIVTIDLEVTAPLEVKERFLVSLDESGPQTDNIKTLTIADTIADPVCMEDSLTFNSIMTTIQTQCTDQQQKILSMLQQNYTYREIADEIGTTSSLVSRQIQQLRKKLKQELNQNDYS